ncbi:MAG: Tfp pilus assembly protein FimT/FimU [Thermodesulfobacteriota bacterium]
MQYTIKPTHTHPPEERGFTIVEILAVLAIIGVIAAVVFPRLSFLEGHYLRSDARRVSGLVHYVSETASIKKLYYRLLFDIEGGTITIESSVNGTDYAEVPDADLRRLRLRDGIEIEDLLLPRIGRINEGAIAVHFSPYGFAEPFTLHMKGGGNLLTLSFNPYNGKVRVSEGYG